MAHSRPPRRETLGLGPRGAEHDLVPGLADRLDLLDRRLGGAGAVQGNQDASHLRAPLGPKPRVPASGRARAGHRDVSAGPNRVSLFTAAKGLARARATRGTGLADQLFRGGLGQGQKLAETPMQAEW